MNGSTNRKKRVTALRNITIYGTDIQTTALGFGTSSLMGKLNKTESLRLLEVAYDNGIRHFDTAPPYGYGEAEAVLGAFLRTHPDATVATKFGLYWPKGPSLLFTRGKQLVRPLLRAFPALRTQARHLVHTGVAPSSRFDADTAAASLATSLRRLHREHIDIFELHECRIPDLTNDRLLDFLLRAQARGDIRSFGIATDIATIKYSAASARSYASVLQFANNMHEPHLRETPSLAVERTCITHSLFGGIQNSPRPSVISALSYAQAHNPNGIVLFSSQNIRHIVDNVRLFSS